MIILENLKNFDLKNKIGIYGIYYKETLLYIGQSKNLHNRIKEHLQELNLNIHCNKRLQEYINEVGVKNIYFIILEIVDNSNREVLLSERENYWWRELSPLFNGYEPSKTMIYSNPKKAGTGIEDLCLYCNKKYIMLNNRQKYCCVECKRADRAKFQTCQYCSVEYKSIGKSGFCSLNCYYASRKIQIECINCNNYFYSKNSSAKFCSKTCNKNFYIQDNFHTCITCFKEFKAVRLKDVKYCSKDCQHINKPYFSKKCEKCSKYFLAAKNYGKTAMNVKLVVLLKLGLKEFMGYIIMAS